MLYLFGSFPNWLIIKLLFVAGLYIYQILTHIIFKQQQQNVFKYSSMQLRIWNEVATLFLVAIVFLVVVKDGLVWTQALGGLFVFILVLLAAIKIYKKIRKA
jgi:putative membrane protein